MATRRFSSFPADEPPPALEIARVADGAGRIRLTLTGEIDMSTTGVLERAVTTVLGARSCVDLVLDLAGVRFMDSSGLSALLRCRADAADLGCRVTVVGARPLVHQAMSITGLLDLFGMTATGPSAAARPAPRPVPTGAARSGPASSGPASIGPAPSGPAPSEPAR